MAAATLRTATLALALFAGGCAAPRRAAWDEVLRDKLATYGHRNVIAIVDAAYPEQARASITTLATGAHQLDVVRRVLDELKGQAHVRPRVLLDRELEYVPEQDAPGIGAYRDALGAALGELPVERVAHEDIIAKLDKTAETFDVLVLKTDLALPYTSVFVVLECGYWSDGAEHRLREALQELR